MADLIEVRGKYSGEVIGTVPSFQVEQLRAIINATHAAFDKHLGTFSLHRRAEILAEAASLIQNRQEEFANLIAREAGKPIKYSRNEVKRASLTLQFSAEEAKRIHGETIPFEAEPRGQDRTGYWYRIPAGLVAAITPFNNPLNLVAHKVGPAIAAGNSILLKPASLAPLSAIKLAETLQEADLPSDLVNVVTGDGERLVPCS